ncbi:hypothetical protein [Actinocorallia longicatena]|uniref:Roadblock/LAMTOR2 domain-containing protein n=1 Tax=Actinocorallia longicatena TaxID=111803 RepID=A0ABP6Q146_9ACTN
MTRVVKTPSLSRANGPLVERAHEAFERSGGLRYLGHFTLGVFDFAVHDDMDATTAESLHRLGRYLDQATSSLGEPLESLASGQLIRAVFETESGAALYFTTRDREYLVGVAREGMVREADRAVAGLVTEIRSLYRRGSQNPGGWEAPTDRLPGGELVAAPDPLRSVHLEGTPPPPDLVVSQLSPETLHYVGIVTDGRMSCSADVLDDPSLVHYFRGISVAERRERYRTIHHRLVNPLRGLGQRLQTAVGGELHRTVLDVEEGALYQIPLRPGAYLLGVTLHQSQVYFADARLEGLAVQLR